ncbi:putative major facilitator superfamily transporter [Pseudovirgaria hyperparasitica]|uniref:Major facilitator superfamily transporter n=1 Tax=Pseudovirgaria hyperparasitica TaxID=470096 RepID=A0A6A6WIQ3_9PEZI|nr:putative major facilitator superfamily transporter [Pseudovirgaria hyperparasitica]KAF2762014.1 putative major facilitator superfamily transporter [Pseudovirgaria hyperparasitica]
MVLASTANSISPMPSQSDSNNSIDHGTGRSRPTSAKHNVSGQDESTAIGTALHVPEKDAAAPIIGELVSETKAEEDTSPEHHESEVENTANHLHGIPLVILTIGLCLATLTVALDNSIIATAIPRITSDFDSFDDAGWYGSSYLLTTTALQPSFGKVYSQYNVKWTYMIALLLFEIGSVICAAAPNSVALIVGRAVAGGGAAALFSGAMTIVAFSVPLHRRAIYIAALSSMFGIASVIGPILGGVFTDRLTWRWCFWINLPIGGVAIVAVFLFFNNPKRPENTLTNKQKLKEIDTLGALFLIGAIVCLLLALQWGGTTYPWGNSKVWGNLLGFGLLLIVFVTIQWKRGDKATLPPRILLRQRTVLASALFSTCLAIALYSHIFYLPYYFQSVKGTTAEESGIRCIPYLIAVTLASIVTGVAITYLGYYSPFTWIGAAIFAIGSGLLYTLRVNSSSGTWIGYEIMAGWGSGMCVQIPFVAVQVVTSEKDMPVANAIAIFFNSLGGAVSISITQNIFANTLSKELASRAPEVNAPLIIASGATQLRTLVPPRLLPQVLDAYMKGITTAFVLPIAAACLAFLSSTLFEWKSIKGKKLAMGGGV